MAKQIGAVPGSTDTDLDPVLGTWVGQAAVDPDIAWAKLASMAEGARRATREFW